MKITRRQLRRIIKETLLLEEPSDYAKDLRAGNITRAEYEQLVRDFENRGRSRGGYGTPENPIQFSSSTRVPEPEPIWTGTPKELEKRVHKYLIDIGFYLDNGIGFVDPFSQGDHPDGGYTSSIPKVIKAGITSGEIDWASWPEIEPTYRKIDRSIN